MGFAFCILRFAFYLGSVDEREKLLKDYGRSLGDVLHALLVPEAGLPRPIIGLDHAMPFFLPVDQDTLQELKALVEDAEKEFHPATLLLHLQPYQDPYHRQTIAVAFPYAELAAGETIARLDDRRSLKLARVVVPSAPPEWRSEKPLELIIQARSAHKRHGEALGVGATIPLRVPRQEIPGKATGI